MNEKERKQELEQVLDVHTSVCTKPFNAESSRLNDEDLPCDVMLNNE